MNSNVFQELTVMTLPWEQAEMVRLLKGAPGTQYQESDDANKAIIRDWVRSLLQKQPIKVTFVKADGTDREMLCTLNWDFIPLDKHPKQPAAGAVVKESQQRKEQKQERKEPDVHSLRVFDTEKLEWRSFRFDRLKKVAAELSFE